MQSDQGKEPTSKKQSKYLVEEVIIDEYIFYSTNPMETIKKIIKKLNIELISFLKVRPQALEIKETINVLMEDIHHYGVKGTFNNDIYSFNILIFLL